MDINVNTCNLLPCKALSHLLIYFGPNTLPLFNQVIFEVFAYSELNRWLNGMLAVSSYIQLQVEYIAIEDKVYC